MGNNRGAIVDWGGSRIRKLYEGPRFPAARVGKSLFALNRTVVNWGGRSLRGSRTGDRCGGDPEGEVTLEKARMCHHHRPPPILFP